ncbi:MAG: hypothetical protein KDK24_10715 [Pseudooceanicola sp.]|nr:hypothetical protein [Pseudooceanicola sp.]
MRGVFIHAGAHRTGTSSFQLCLAQNRAALARHGLEPVYPGRDGAPGGRLRMDLPRPRHGARRIPEFAGKLRAHLDRIANGQRLILSEENIPGPMHHFYEGRFFPASANRLASLAQALGERPAHLVYVLRPYHALYVSAYRKRAEDNAVPPFETLVPHFLSMDRGWPDLIVDFRDILKPERLTVIDFARRGSSTDLLRRLVPELQDAPLEEPDQVVNLSATDRALEHLQTRYHAGETLPREIWQAEIERFRGDPEPTGFASFSTEDAATLQARYDADLHRIADMDGITLA